MWWQQEVQYFLVNKILYVKLDVGNVNFKNMFNACHLSSFSTNFGAQSQQKEEGGLILKIDLVEGGLLGGSLLEHLWYIEIMCY